MWKYILSEGEMIVDIRIFTDHVLCSTPICSISSFTKVFIYILRLSLLMQIWNIRKDFIHRLKEKLAHILKYKVIFQLD